MSEEHIIAKAAQAEELWKNAVNENLPAVVVAFLKRDMLVWSKRAGL